ncbi:ferrochelatase [Aliivibrio finisterrensis]|uniref:Ferrochelatase n=1 Tax=Aliivibrio finisterrensis TaxID=511998 RepID=A0A4Q5KNN4_9GAMM|nr:MULTISPECIES: ferrochelatase [Aliivibrio]MDD9173269.1 ferrochelatase [Aliivibrio sp. S3TY1]MDD9190345.1 ferrochelatase [Aliivibrio sp. S2TY2]RYU47155.1 ferrochelatase [Aliivibrio finisterrensis]RYU71093.1 ferrochelatase [Aliivibrio finisterrensis]RYU74822.1 ferrochelatase [Aliivibrio finisterrensis]
MNNKKAGVLLVNLGTPTAPTTSAVKTFLSDFLHDKRVVDMNRFLWCPLLHGVILPIRAPKVAKLYESVWMDEGSPLMVYSKRQAAALHSFLNVPVELGMTYGEPSIKSGIERLEAQGCDEIVILPLYPQYSRTTSAAVFDQIAKQYKTTSVLPDFSLVHNYHDHPLYIKALAESIRLSWEKKGKGDYVLCSYHGIPQRFVDNGDIYAKHCERTTELLAQELGLTSEQIGMSYQSRFGREAWLQPYTSEMLTELTPKGIKSLDIISPAFSSDCLETLEELSEECKEIFMEAGGQKYTFIPCLNDDELHIEMMADIVKSKISA